MKEDGNKEVAENRYLVEFPGEQRGAEVGQEGGGECWSCGACTVGSGIDGSL